MSEILGPKTWKIYLYYFSFLRLLLYEKFHRKVLAVLKFIKFLVTSALGTPSDLVLKSKLQRRIQNLVEYLGWSVLQK